jgi:hypothetical protein
MTPFIPSTFISITLEPVERDDFAAIAAELVIEPFGDFAALFDQSEPSWVTPDALRQFVTSLGGLSIYFDGSEGYVRFGGLDSADNEREFQRLLSAIPRQHAEMLVEVISSVTVDYTPTIWLERYIGAEYARPINSLTIDEIKGELYRFERELVSCGARPATEQLAWRLGVPYGWRIG